MRLLLRTLRFCNPQRKRVILHRRNYFDSLIMVDAVALVSFSTRNTL